MLRDFCFRSESDRSNYLGILLTAILMPRFIGCKPAVLFNGNQPGLGKTMLAQMIALLRDGRTAETVSYNRNDEEFEKRLGEYRLHRLVANVDELIGPQIAATALQQVVRNLSERVGHRRLRSNFDSGTNASGCRNGIDRMDCRSGSRATLTWRRTGMR